MATLTINFTPASPAPTDGYVIKYREVGGTTYTTISPNPTASPVTISGLSGTSYEGTIQAQCGISSDSSTVPFVAAGQITPCNSGASFAGGQAFPSDVVITLGSGTGTVSLHYDAISIPDKFVVIYDGVTVIDTGYMGDSSNQSALDAALAGRGLPPETIAGVASGTMTFNKTTTTTTALVRVYAPMEGTAWNFTLSCPTP